MLWASFLHSEVAAAMGVFKRLIAESTYPAIEFEQARTEPDDNFLHWI